MKTSTQRYTQFAALVVMLTLGVSMQAMAGSGAANLSSVTNFFDNIKSLLSTISVVVVSIAFVFAGYQIAFNQKRVSDVMPVLLGGLIIGGASQFASWLFNASGGNGI